MKTVMFTSWSDMLDYVRRTPPTSNWDAKSRLATEQRERFTQTSSFDAAMRLAELGWPEATAKATALTSAMVDKVTSLVEHERITYDVTGRDFDVSMMLTGEPEHWSNTETVITTGTSTRILKLVINTAVSSAVDTDVIIARGSAIAALVAVLELSGFRVEIEMTSPFADQNRKVLINFVIPVKSADQPLDLDRLIFAAAHPSMERRLMFSALEHNVDERNALRNYGWPTEVPKANQGDIYIGHSSSEDDQWTRTETAARWVLDQAKAQGVTLTRN